MRGQAPYRELYVYSLLYLIFCNLYEGEYICETDSKKKVSSDAVQELVEWIDAHYYEPVSLKQLSTLAHINEKYLCRVFREYTGHTPIEYINVIRVEKSAEAMLLGRTITDAAFDNGFNDLSYFSKTFRKYMACSPREYAKRQKSMRVNMK